MALKVTLAQDPLRGSGQKILKVVCTRTMDYDECLARMGNAGSPDLLQFHADFQRFIQVIFDSLLDGTKVITPIGTFSATIHSPNNGTVSAVCDIAKEGLSVNLCLNRNLLKQLRTRAKVEQVEPVPSAGPSITVLKNLTAEGRDEIYSPKNIMQIHGRRLHFNKEDIECGVFLISTDGQGETRCPFYSRNGTAIVQSHIPNLPSGEFAVELRVRGGRNVLRSVRAGTLVHIVS